MRNGRVAASGTTVTVTVASTGFTSAMPSGTASGTRKTFVAERPPTSTAKVSMRSTLEIAVCSPRTVTATGSVATCEIQ